MSARPADCAAAAASSRHARPFGALSAEEQAVVRDKQRAKKEQKLRRKEAAGAALEDAGAASLPGEITRTHITEDEYFAACGGARFRDPRVPPTEAGLALVLSALGPDGALSACQYFQFSGADDAVWAPRFNARLLYEGFFTITAATGPARAVEPLPERQPY